MKNKLYIITITTCLLLLASCSGSDEPEVEQGEKIVFAPDALTKAPVANFVVGDKLGVLAYETDASGIWNASGRPDFMYNVPLEKTITGYEYGPAKFYPPGGRKVKFFGYYPYSSIAGDSGITLSVASATGYPTLTYQCPSIADRDLLVAVTEPQNSGSVYLPCEHVLAKVNFTLTISGDGNTYTISSLRIKRVAMVGTFSFEKYVNDPVSKTGWWSEWATQEDMTVNCNLPVTQGEQTMLLKVPLLLIPQTFTVLSVELDYSENGSAYTKTFTSNNITWLPGGNYKYNMSLQGGFSGEVVEPED